MFFLDRRKLNPRKLAKRKIKKEKRQAFKEKIKNIRGKGFKTLCWVIEIHGILCITTSYVLAFLDKMNPLETLSATITTEIVAPIVVLGFTRMIENIFEHNQLAFSTPLDYLENRKKYKNDEREDGGLG